ncbi:MAG: hypothetical protein PHR25_06995 [Clostridia bacterium]|nr:hypothetical protein [Clostridia bacterium]
MTTKKERTAIYIKAKTAKTANTIKKNLMKYCLVNNYEIVDTFVGMGDDCIKDLIGMWQRKRFSKIVVLKLNHFGNSSKRICSVLDFINNNNKTVEVVIKRINLNIYVNDLIRKIKIYFGRVFDYKNRVLYSKPNCDCKLNASYSHRERGGK